MSDREYFAASEQGELAAELENRLKSWGDYIDRSGLKRKWEKSYRFYYGNHFGSNSSMSSSSIHDLGDEGELKGVTVNHYRNLIKHMLTLTTSEKPAYQCRAINSDLKSLQQAKLGNNILDAYFVGKRLLRPYKKAAEMSLIFGQGFIEKIWEPSEGRPYTTETVEKEDGETFEKTVYEGDVYTEALSPYDVYTDPGLSDFDKANWIVTRRFRNKFDLAARYTDLEDKILEAEADTFRDSVFRYFNFDEVDSTTMIPVYSFYHKRTDSLPNGRYMLFIDGETVLYDGPIPYSKLPVFRIVPGEYLGTTEGYADAFDLLPLQEAYNTLLSSVYTNEQAFGVQNVLIPRSCNLSTEQITDSLQGLKYDPQGGKPEALQLCASPPEIFNTIGILNQLMETISGINSVSRGNPDSSLKSGVALALVQSMTVQYASAFQESWANLIEDGGSFMLDLLKNFAKTERIAAMAGKYNRSQTFAFTGDDLQNVDRVVVELGNPLMRTTAGRVQIADNLLERGLVQTPKQYLQVVETGSLEALTEGAEAELDLIRQENELLMDGEFETVRVIVGDAHLLHMQEHRALLANPMVRANSEIVGQVLAHIKEHDELYHNQMPIYSQIAGEPPAQQAPPQNMPPPNQQDGTAPGELPEALQPPVEPGTPLSERE